MLTFVLDPNETPGQRVARVAREAVATGPMGAYLQRERYASFLDVWNLSYEDYSPLIDKLHGGAVLAGVKTSCAVDASAVLGYCGKKLRKPWHADGSWGITSWLQVGFDHDSWVDAFSMELDERREAVAAGDVLYRGTKVGANGHVVILVERVADLWITVEGGGNLTPTEKKSMSAQHVKATNGTVMRESQPKDIWTFDSSGRLPAGWWRCDKIGVPTYDEILDHLNETNKE